MYGVKFRQYENRNGLNIISSRMNKGVGDHPSFAMMARSIALLAAIFLGVLVVTAAKEHSCGASEFRCTESGICLPNIWRCDGERDCSHGEDEVDCRDTCKEKDLFACK